MDLRAAVQLVGADSRNDISPDMTDTEAVAHHRDSVGADIDGSVDDPELLEAYHLVTAATNADLAQVMA